MKAIISILQANSTITDKLSNGASSVFTDFAPQEDTAPYIIVDSEIADSNATYSGENLDVLSVHIHCISSRKYNSSAPYGAQDIADAVRSLIVGSSGTVSGEDYAVTMLESEDVFKYNDPNIPRIAVEQVYQVMRTRTDSSPAVGSFVKALLLTQAEYTGLGSYDSNTYYLISDA